MYNLCCLNLTVSIFLISYSAYSGVNLLNNLLKLHFLIWVVTPTLLFHGMWSFPSSNSLISFDTNSVVFILLLWPIFSLLYSPPDLGLHTLIKKISTVPVVSVNIYLLMPPKSVSPIQITLMSSRPIGQVSQYFLGLSSVPQIHIKTVPMKLLQIPSNLLHFSYSLSQ